MQENETIVENTTKKTKKKKSTKKSKFKAKYLVPVIFVLVVAVVALSVFMSLGQDGPVYGERCANVTSVSESDLDSVENSIPQSLDTVEDLLIEINCKTMAIDVTMAEGASKEDVTEACESILLAIDEAVGLSKSNSESKYSDLFGTYNGKTQYHVDFTIEGSDDLFPIFASKHPSSDTINFTYNEARNEELVAELTSESQEDDTTNE